MNYIFGEKFKTLVNTTVYEIEDIFISQNNIFYIDTHNVNDFLQQPPTEPFILISHNSDGKIIDYNSICCANTNYIPNNLIKWYGQNVCVKHPKIESIPIGLENSIHFPAIKKTEKIKLKSKQPKQLSDKLLYICHNINTNRSQRLEPYEIFKNKFWVTLEYGNNGYNFDHYLDQIHSHKFVLCPEGNGTDTHRTWETLYVGSIPIEKRNINNQFYTDLPICFVDQWTDISEEFLHTEYQRIINMKWNLEKLNFNYWKNKISQLL